MSSVDADAADKDCSFGVVDFPAGPPRRGRCKLSTVWLTSSTGQRVRLPEYALLRLGEPLTRQQRPTVCDCARACAQGVGCARGWPRLEWKHVTVVLALDNCGLLAAGWFVQFATAALSLQGLVRVPTAVAMTLLDDLPLECEAWDVPDVATQRPWSNFQALAEARYAHLVAPDRPVAQRTRSRPRSPPPPTESRWQLFALSRAPKGPRDGECAVCFNACTVLVPSCCGVSAAVCADCNDQTRGACIVCQRGHLGGAYICACCGMDGVPLDKYGHACAGCEARVLCVNCAGVDGECAACDPLRS